MPLLRLGTAGWAIPRAVAAGFPREGSGLTRYAARFDAAEINSTFYRPHKPDTFARWADGVPDAFRFSVKLPKAITHERRLVDTAEPLDRFLGPIAALGTKLGALLVQLPPSLAFEPGIAGGFCAVLRAATSVAVALEPRHASWFDAEAGRLLAENRIARVAADPARVPAAAEPGGFDGLVYIRLHGSPRTYWSPYDEDRLRAVAARIAAADVETWCIFDNTASGAAAADALALLRLMRGGPGTPD